MFARKKLAVANILLGACWVAYKHRALLARVLLPPVVVLALLSVVLSNAGIHRELFSSFLRGGTLLALGVEVTSAVLFSLLVIPCHRLVLLGPASITPPFYGWTRRETQFALSVFVFWLSMRLLMIIFMLLFSLVVVVHDPQVRSYVISYVAPAFACILTSYIGVRVCLIFPSIANDQGLALSSAWRMSRGNGWRLLVIAVVFALMPKWMPAFFSGMHALLTCFVAAVSLVMPAIAAMALSLAYRELNPQFQTDKVDDNQW